MTRDEVEPHETVPSGDVTSPNSETAPGATVSTDMQPETAPLNERRSRRNRVAVGPTYLARLTPWLRWGAPVVALIVLPLSTLAVLEQEWWLRYPLAYLIGFLALSVLMASVLGLVHRTTWWDPQARTVSRGRKRLDAGDITSVHEDYRRQGTTTIHAGSTVLEVPCSGWDARSFDGVRVLQRDLGVTQGPTRTELLHRDYLARSYYTNRALAEKYAMPWRPEYEDPDVFLAAFDARRWELTRSRR